MSDRELLELAAKAVGEEVEWLKAQKVFYRKSCNWPQEKGYFNPLHDDGEALRLAADLKMNLEIGEAYVAAIWFDLELSETHRHELKSPWNEDYMPNLRRVIVYAAADMATVQP